MSDSVRPHRQQPTRLLRLWDFPGKSSGVGCHCLLLNAKCLVGNPREKWLYFPGILTLHPLQSARTPGAGQAQSWGLETKLRTWSLWSSKLSTRWPETPLWHGTEASPPCTSAGGHRTLRWAETSWRQDWVILMPTSSPEPSQCQQWVRGCFSGGSLSPSEKNDQPCLGECVCVCVGTGLGAPGESQLSLWSQPVLPTINNPHLHKLSCPPNAQQLPFKC